MREIARYIVPEISLRAKRIKTPSETELIMLPHNPHKAINKIEGQAFAMTNNNSGMTSSNRISRKDHNSSVNPPDSIDEGFYPTGATVPFPFDRPYPQQVQLMDALLEALQSNTKVALLESPTGTGKSLSLACASLAWLRHTEREARRAKAAVVKHNDTTMAKQTSLSGNNSKSSNWWDDWVDPEDSRKAELVVRSQQRANETRERLNDALGSIRSRLHTDDSNTAIRRENLVRSAVTAAKMTQRKKLKRLCKLQKQKVSVISKRRVGHQRGRSVGTVNEEDFCLEDYRSDREELRYESEDDDFDDAADVDNRLGDKRRSSGFSGHSSMLDGANLDGSSVQNALLDVTPGGGVRKIVYAARTHSQLSQFVSEIRRTAWGETARVVALGGRAHLCTNPQVNRKGRSEQTISDDCLDMAKSSSTKCPFRAGLSTLAVHLLAHPSDIEDAARLGKASHACAYYATRESLAAAEVVVLPYSLLLSEPARQSVGLSLRNALVLVDEAHNVPEAIRNLHSGRLTLPVVLAALEQVAAYTDRYATRLAGRNLFYLGQIRRCLLAFRKDLNDQTKTATAMKSDSSGAGAGPDTVVQRSTMETTSSFLVRLKLDNVNLFKLLRYLVQSRLSQKLLGFTQSRTTLDKHNDANEGNSNDKSAATKQRVDEKTNVHSDLGLSKHVSAMAVVQTFLEKLTSDEGKVVRDQQPPSGRLHQQQSAPQYRFVLLYPSSQMESIIQDAHTVALVGGTLRPFGHLAAELLSPPLVDAAQQADSFFSSGPRTTIHGPGLSAFSCTHVVPASHVCLKRLSTGPSGVPLDFRHCQRQTHRVVLELGRVLLRLVRVVPAGVVVFLASYAYETHVVRIWQTTTYADDTTRTASGSSRSYWDELRRYKAVYREPKSSRDIDSTLREYSRDATSTDGGSGGALLFSVIGGKLSEGINFANDMARAVVVVGLPYPDLTDVELQEKMRALDCQKSSGLSGQDYYHNLCMRAVNQTVGRAIRHAQDYAAVLLLDRRYSTDMRVWMSLPSWLKRQDGDGGRAGTNSQETGFGGAMSHVQRFFDDKTEAQ